MDANITTSSTATQHIDAIDQQPDTSSPLPNLVTHPIVAPGSDQDTSSAASELTPLQIADLRYRTAIAEGAEIDVLNKRRALAIATATDAENRTYMFFTGTSDDPIKKAIEDLNVLSRRFQGEPLTIVLNSPGGSVYQGLALYDHIRSLSNKGHHITVIVRGMAASMGGILLQSGDRRIIGSESEVLIHAVSSGTIGPLYEMEDAVDHIKRLWDKLVKILAKRSTLTEKQIRARAARKDWWLDAQTALDLGFADAIG